MEKEITTIYSLKLHEGFVVETLLEGSQVKGRIEITRVPGGWIYSLDYPGYRQSPVIFVPFNNEFMETLKINKK